MNYDGGGSPLFGGNLVLVGPPAVVGHGGAFEHFGVEFRRVVRVWYRGIVDKHDNRLSLDVHTFETRSEEHTSELQSLRHLVCRLLLEKKKRHNRTSTQ